MASEKQYKVFNCVLYPDSTTYDCATVIETVQHLGCEWYAALHDSDVDENGKPKKPHYHVIMRFDSGKYIQTIAKDLGIADHDIERPKKGGFKGGVRYLIHANAPDKFQYDRSIIFGSGDPTEYLAKDSDALGVLLMDAIYSGEVQTVQQLYTLAKEAGAWSEFRRGFYMYNSILHDLRAAAIADSASRRSDAGYEARRTLQAEIDAKREEIAYMNMEKPLDEIPQEVISEFDN